jgi:hypothetical protein
VIFAAFADVRLPPARAGDGPRHRDLLTADLGPGHRDPVVPLFAEGVVLLVDGLLLGASSHDDALVRGGTKLVPCGF